MVSISRFFFSFFDQFSKFYKSSQFYDKKISKIYNTEIVYEPSPHLLSSLIKYQKKKIKIEDFSIDEIWSQNNLSKKEFKNLHNFYWFFGLDLKSSKHTTQSIISNWISRNKKYNHSSWDFDLTAKRIISWLSCHNLTYKESNDEYRENFNYIIQKQTNHLINEIKRSEHIEDKLIGCASIILVGLCYQNESRYLSFGSNLLKKIIKFTLDNNSFPKSRDIKQLTFYLKYLILIKEWFKESQNKVPDHIEETIYYLGQGYAFLCQNLEANLLFNGNNNSNNSDFDNYLKRLGYTFKNENQDFGGYTVLKNKKIILSMDTGPSPNFKFSENYQSGDLSF